MGATGAAVGRVLAQGTLCLVLFSLFMSRSNRNTYATNAWAFSPKLFWHYIRPGLWRALGAFPALGDWVIVSRYMSLKSEVHLLVFSLGSTIFYLLTFIGDGLFQTMVTVSSNHIGKREHSNIWTSYTSGLVLLFTAAVLLMIPFFLFPQSLIHFFNAASFYPQILTIYHEMNQWLWLAVVAYAMNTLTVGIIVASRDTLFLLGFYCSMWIFSFIPVYVTMTLLQWNADKFWLIVMFTNLVACVVFLWRSSKEKWKIDNWQPEPPTSEVNPPLTTPM